MPTAIVFQRQLRRREFRARSPVIARLPGDSVPAMTDTENASFAGLLATLVLTNIAVVWFALTYFAG
jgi:hypothetical protein